MCGVKDGFTRVSRALDLLNESGLPFYCTTTIVHENMHDFAAMYRFAAEKQLKFYHTSAVALSARSDLGTPETSRTRTDEIQWTLESMKKEMVKVVDLRPFARCAGVNMTFFLTWHGHLGFCGFSPKPYVQIKFPLDFKSAWEQMLDQVAAIKTPEECQTCEHVEFCRRCPGLLASESGDPEKVSKSFCSQAAEKHRIYNELKAKAESTAESECKETPQE
jgi:radical SAM protein with 4Fe4S-binding SPASM domain